MKEIWFVVAVIVGAVLFSLAVVLACCRLAGDLSRQEEKMVRLKPCPVCGKIPKLGYCCGEYFVAGEDPDCLGCGVAFTEMHSSPELEIDAWNRRAEDGK